MKRISLIPIIVSVILLTGCEGNNSSTKDFITVDVTKSYP